MLKITEHREGQPPSLLLTLEGRLAGPWVEELETSWRRTTANCQDGAVIDLSGVTFVDPEGKALLAKLWQQGAKLRATGCLTRCIVEEITKTGGVAGPC